MTAGVRLIIMGRQGAGKGTQCQRISRHYVVPHISTGDILRAAVREGTELGKMAGQVIKAGRLVGDDIMIEIIRERLEQDDARTRGYILDGFPRTVAQAIALDAIAKDIAKGVAADPSPSKRPRSSLLGKLEVLESALASPALFDSTHTVPARDITCKFLPNLKGSLNSTSVSVEGPENIAPRRAVAGIKGSPDSSVWSFNHARGPTH